MTKPYEFAHKYPLACPSCHRNLTVESSVRAFFRPAGHEFEQITKGISTKFDLLKEDELRPNERIWLELICFLICERT